VIARKLRDVEALPEADADRLLGSGERPVIDVDDEGDTPVLAAPVDMK
jgi:hypothetical protein